MYALIALFLCVPLYFSHIFAPFGIIIGNGGSFERQKGYLIAILLLLATFEKIFTRRNEMWSFFRKYYISYINLLLIPMLSYLVTPERDILLFFIGSPEKNHGYIWYTFLLLASLLLFSSAKQDRRKFLNASIVGAFIVALITIGEYFLSASLFFGQMEHVSWGAFRSIATLGNPDYIAGYLLMHISLSRSLRAPERYIFFIILTLALFATKSYIGGALLGVYLVWELLPYCSIKKIGPRMLAMALSIVLVGGGLFLQVPHEKLLSLLSRWVLMKELWTVIVSYPIVSLFGFGPESIIAYFDTPRSTMINHFFPSESAIDSSHNILLDILFQYGVIAFGIFSSLFVRHISTISREARAGAILGLLFCMLNITISLHVLTFLLLLSDKKEISS